MTAAVRPIGSNTDDFEHLARKSKAERRIQLYLLLALGDLSAVVIGFAAASLARLQDGASDQIKDVLPVVAILFATIASSRGAYGVDALTQWRSGLKRALSSLMIAALVVVAIAFAWRISSDFSRLFICLGVLLSANVLVASRWVVHRVARRLLPNGAIEQVVLSDGGWLRGRPEGTVLDAGRLGLRPDLDSPAALDRLGRALHQADRIILACAPAAREAWVAALKCAGRDVEILLPEIESLGVLDVAYRDGHLTAGVARGQLTLGQRVLKRLFDLAVVIWLAPTLTMVWIVVAALIKLEDGGPVLFVQRRVGQGNRTFDIYKFRTMRVDGSDGAGSLSTSRGDPRLTRIGALLRRTSVDELPQLLNVLLGDMSIVGPRPHAIGSTASGELFWSVDLRYWSRHAAKPGLTGLAQVRGWRGATHHRDALVGRIQCDLEYLSGWSLWRDLWILAATARVLVHDHAY